MHYFFYILIYAFTSYAVYLIAVRLSAPRPWFAGIPFAREWLLIQMAGKSWKWYVAILVPVLNIVVAWIVWGDIARKANRSVWLGRAMIIPVVNIALLASLSFEFSWRDVWVLMVAFAKKIRGRKNKESPVEV